MALKRIAVVVDGRVENVIVVETDPELVPGIVRATGTYGDAVVVEIAKLADVCVELRDDEACGPGDAIKLDAAEAIRANPDKAVSVVVKHAERDERVETFTRAALVV